jgi:hypothetical protein
VNNGVDFEAGTSNGQQTFDTQGGCAAADAEDFPGGQNRLGTQRTTAVGEHNPPAPAILVAPPKACPPVLASNPWRNHNGPLLALLADTLDDLERTRIANENRLRQLTRTETDSDGEERGFGLTLDQPQVAALAAVVEALAKLEHQSTLNLQRALRQHPLGPWVKTTTGIGEKQGARLIAAIGDPYWHTLHDRPRTVSELWAYCGLHVLHPGQCIRDAHHATAGVSKQRDPGHRSAETQSSTAGVAPTRARGEHANWSTVAKTRAYLVAESCIKQARSPYRAVYDTGRAKYAEALHERDCRRCGPSGKPGLVGSPLSAGHQHARAMRLVSKEILKDLWRESKRLHGS